MQNKDKTQKIPRLRALACFALSALLCFALQPTIVWAASDKDDGGDSKSEKTAKVEEVAAPEPEAAAEPAPAEVADQAAADSDSTDEAPASETSADEAPIVDAAAPEAPAAEEPVQDDGASADSDDAVQDEADDADVPEVNESADTMQDDGSDAQQTEESAEPAATDDAAQSDAGDKAQADSSEDDAVEDDATVESGKDDVADVADDASDAKDDAADAHAADADADPAASEDKNAAAQEDEDNAAANSKDGKDVADTKDSDEQASKKKSDKDSEKDSSDAKESSSSSRVKSLLKQIDASIADANAAAGAIGGSVAELRSAKAAYDEACAYLSELLDEQSAEQQRADYLEGRLAVVKPAAELSANELASIETTSVGSYAVKKGISLFDARARESQLSAMSQDAASTLETLDSEYEACKQHEAELAEAIDAQRTVVDEALKYANGRAYQVEIYCSEARSGEVAATEKLEEMGGSSQEATDARQAIEAAKNSHLQMRGSAYSALDEWYDCLDAQAGADEPRLTFGTGLDFAMDEEAFVAKWGAAIDAYYEELGYPPLYGYGEYMAREAWEWQIDPRLCAAVSFTESGGGRACIRNCNAWGWGAADSDPYNLASEWGSWEEAITAWHTGMGTNNMGLAGARSVDELGCSYAGAPHWSSNVVTAMQRIEELAETQPIAVPNLTLSQPSA